MSLNGILLDVSGSMRDNIGSGVDEEGGPWAQSIFKVIDDLIEHDLTSENRVFAIGVGASCILEIIDIIGTLKEIENMEIPSYQKNMPATSNRVNEILDILETNGSCNIRKWVGDISLIQDEVSDYIAALICRKLECDSRFRKKFVCEFLPSACQDGALLNAARQVFMRMSGAIIPIDTARPPPFRLPMLAQAEDVCVSVVSTIRPATREDIHEVVEKAKCYFLKDVKFDPIFSVQNASRIIRGCVDDNELSTERMKELLKNVEPFIYGRTPLYKSLEEAAELFKSDNSENKMLFVLSDGIPTDGSNEDNAKIRPIISKLTEMGVKVVSCFVTKSTDIQPKRLYDKIQPGWESGAKFMFLLSSQVPTQHLPRAILVKRGWEIDIVNNETKLFIQVNHPDNLRYNCKIEVVSIILRIFIISQHNRFLRSL